MYWDLYLVWETPQQRSNNNLVYSVISTDKLAKILNSIAIAHLIVKLQMSFPKFSRIGWATPGVCCKQDSCPEGVSETLALSSFKITTVNNYADSLLLLSDFLNSNLCK
jgi:hypothetical protein